MVFKFTIDRVLNRYVAANQTDKLPRYVRWVLGNHSSVPRGDHWIWMEILIASFAGIALLEGISMHPTVFTHHHAPLVIASYGATAILCFNSNAAPLAQPRNILVGHFLSALIGVCIQKLFSLSNAGVSNYWASGALSVGVSSVAMSIFNCVHPPAGASALLPSIDAEIRQMSWWYLPFHLVSSVLIICVACITGNVIRKYPQYWWTPASVGRDKDVKTTDKGDVKDKETDSSSASAHKPSDSSDHPLASQDNVIYEERGTSISISANEIIVPKHLQLEDVDLGWLEEMRLRLRQLDSTDPPV